MKKQRKVNGVYRGDGIHWVGDGFRVTNYFPSGNDFGSRVSPFVMMDYAPPFEYKPRPDEPRGVGTHPHRGFETVTIAFAGSLAHSDSAGNSGVIGPGDVQWMTAASGVLHQEYHDADFARSGGAMQMMQLWVNLPRAHKMDPPRYQALTAGQMGLVKLPDAAGEVRVIAGEYDGVRGPAKTFTPVNMFEVRLLAKGHATFSVPEKQNTMLVVLGGEATINGTQSTALDLVLFENDGEEIFITTNLSAHLLLLSGEPIDEPVVQYGPFVMNTREDIRQAIEDFNTGKFGHIAE